MAAASSPCASSSIRSFTRGSAGRVRRRRPQNSLLAPSQLPQLSSAGRFLPPKRPRPPPESLALRRITPGEFWLVSPSDWAVVPTHPSQFLKAVSWWHSEQQNLEWQAATLRYCQADGRHNPSSLNHPSSCVCN